ncbi:MAG: GGDEF domain-containing protein [Myxococcales bacterium]|nr:GGDEF domain-containing protein [Myxococcales bacterium]
MTVSDWSCLQGPFPGEPLIDLAQKLTSTMAEIEVIRLLAEEIEHRVRPRYWLLLVGDREELRIEHVGGQASASLLRTRPAISDGALRRALDSFEGQVILDPTIDDLCGLELLHPSPSDLVIVPFGGYEVVGCLVMLDALQFNPSQEDLLLLRHALRLGGVGIRNAQRHAQLCSETDAFDSVTGLPGPNRFRAALQTELERTKRNHCPTSVLLMDIDHFKRVNKEHGRLVGTSLLAEVGTILQSSIRRVDLASRWCGDTFALLLPETGQSGVITVAKRLQEHLRRGHFDVGVGAKLHLTASVGITIFEEAPVDPEQAVYEAESLMRQAQNAGTIEALMVTKP